MKQSVSLTAKINSSNEKETILMVRSLRNNGGFYANAPVFLVFGAGISPTTRAELDRLKVVEVDNNALYRDVTKTISMVRLKPECVFLREPIFENLYDHEIAAPCMMAKYPKHYSPKATIEYNEGVQAEYYIKTLLFGTTRPNYYRHINTWFVQAASLSHMWAEWQTKTKLVKDKIKTHEEQILKSEFVSFSGQGKYNSSLDYAYSLANNIGMGLLDVTGKYEVRDAIGVDYRHADMASHLCYYGEWGRIQKITTNKDLINDIKDINKLLK
jgi:hypothetical protein